MRGRDRLPNRVHLRRGIRRRGHLPNVPAPVRGTCNAEPPLRPRLRRPSRRARSEPGASTRTRTSSTTARSGVTLTGLQSISTTAGCASTSAPRRRIRSSSAPTAALRRSAEPVEERERARAIAPSRPRRRPTAAAPARRRHRGARRSPPRRRTSRPVRTSRRAPTPTSISTPPSICSWTRNPSNGARRVAQVPLHLASRPRSPSGAAQTQPDRACLRLVQRTQRLERDLPLDAFGRGDRPRRASRRAPTRASADPVVIEQAIGVGHVEPATPLVERVREQRGRLVRTDIVEDGDVAAVAVPATRRGSATCASAIAACSGYGNDGTRSGPLLSASGIPRADRNDVRTGIVPSSSAIAVRGCARSTEAATSSSGGM